MKIFLTFIMVVSTTLLALGQPATKLILHRDNLVLSNHSMDIQHSMARFAYLKAKLADVAAEVIFDKSVNLFFVNLSIGEPPVSQLLAMDTSTSLLWVQCVPCIRCTNNARVFNPSMSSTYTSLKCKSMYCQLPITSGCDLKDRCRYAMGGNNKTMTEGLLATEKFTFITSDGGIIELSNVAFGCGHDNGVDLGKKNGVLGLGPGESNISLPYQLGSKLFSYCIGNINDPLNKDNQLIIGNGAKMEGDKTPLTIHGGLYHLSLEGISVGQTRLVISPGTFQRDSMGNGGVVLDTGSTVTYLVRGGFEPLTNEVQHLMDGLFNRVIRDDYLCYNGDLDDDVSGFPVVTLHFAGGAELNLDVDSLFRQHNPNIFCMEVLVSDQMSLIGIMAQLNYNVGYDLNSMKISFRRIDCELLEE